MVVKSGKKIMSVKARAALDWLIEQRREACDKGFHDFVCRQDRRLTPFMVVTWFQRHCPELNSHHNGIRVFLQKKS